MVYQHDLTTDAEAHTKQSGHCFVPGRGRGTGICLATVPAKYTDEDSFAAAGLQIRYQQFTQPAYPQAHAAEFVPGISMLDMLFNCGIEGNQTYFLGNLPFCTGIFREGIIVMKVCHMTSAP